MKTRLSLIALSITIMLLAACGMLNNIAPEAKPYAVYLQALNVFNSNLRTYLDVRDTMPLDVQAEWKNRIEPLIVLTKEALDDWGMLVIQGLPDAMAKRKYDRLFTEVLALMLKYEIIELRS